MSETTPPRRLRRWYNPLTWVSSPMIDSTIDMRTEGRSMIASAQRLIASKVAGGSQRRTEPWMTEGWTMFDLVGELHYIATTLARRAAKARFYVGRVVNGDVVELLDPKAVVADAVTATPTVPLDPAIAAAEKKARYIFNAFGDGFLGLQEIVERAFVNQFVVGASYLVGAPEDVWRPEMRQGRAPRAVAAVPVEELVWKTLSVKEFVAEGLNYELKQEGSANGGVKSIPIAGQSVFVIALWTSHPSDMSMPDSPVRASLPVLREIVGLTQHVSAQIDSRLAGAGMLVMRSSHSRAMKRAMGLPEDSPEDPFTSLLIEAMVTPISDRDSASAVVPYVMTIPDESLKPEYISFSGPLDQYAAGLREESIRRLALGLDAPPELLLGQGDTSHWTAWLTQEEVVDSHISPTLALIARALTLVYLRPILRANGLSAEDAAEFAIWFDTSSLTVKANQGADAITLYGMDLLSDEAVRRATGFDESDAPKKADVKDQAIDIVKDMMIANPGLMNRPGLDVLVDQVTSLLGGTPKSGIQASAAAVESSGSSEIADTEGAEPDAAPTPASGPTTTPASSGARPAPPGPVLRRRAPSTKISEPGIPDTRMAAAGATDTFGTW